MQTFCLLYFRDSVLERTEEVVKRDVLEAVSHAAGQPPEIRIEIWSDHLRVGVIAAHHSVGVQTKRRDLPAVEKRRANLYRQEA